MSSGEGVTVRSTCASSPCGLAMRSRAVARHPERARKRLALGDRVVHRRDGARQAGSCWKAGAAGPESNVTQAWYTSLPGRVFG